MSALRSVLSLNKLSAMRIARSCSLKCLEQLKAKKPASPLPVQSYSCFLPVVEVRESSTTNGSVKVRVASEAIRVWVWGSVSAREFGQKRAQKGRRGLWFC